VKAYQSTIRHRYVHSVSGAGKTVRSSENACHTWEPWRCVHD